MFKNLLITVYPNGYVHTSDTMAPVAPSEVAAQVQYERERQTRNALREGSEIKTVESTEYSVIVIMMSGLTLHHIWTNVPE